MPAPAPLMIDFSLKLAHPAFASGQGFMTNPNSKKGEDNEKGNN
jgi:hypothetical protein